MKDYFNPLYPMLVTYSITQLTSCASEWVFSHMGSVDSRASGYNLASKQFILMSFIKCNIAPFKDYIRRDGEGSNTADKRDHAPRVPTPLENTLLLYTRTIVRLADHQTHLRNVATTFPSSFPNVFAIYLSFSIALLLLGTISSW